MSQHLIQTLVGVFPLISISVDQALRADNIIVNFRPPSFPFPTHIPGEMHGALTMGHFSVSQAPAA